MKSSGERIEIEKIKEMIENSSDFYSLLFSLKEQAVFSLVLNEEQYIDLMCVFQRKLKQIVFQTLSAKDKTIKNEDIGILAFEIVKINNVHFILSEEYRLYYKKEFIALLNLNKVSMTNEYMMNKEIELNKIENIKQKSKQETEEFSLTLEKESFIRTLLLKSQEKNDKKNESIINTLSLYFRKKTIRGSDWNE